MGCVIQFSLFDTHTWFFFFFEAIEGCLVFKYLASVGGKTRTTINNYLFFWTMISFPRWLNTERKEQKKKRETGVKRDAMRLTIVQKLGRVSTKRTLPP